MRGFCCKSIFAIFVAEILLFCSSKHTRLGYWALLSGYKFKVYYFMFAGFRYHVAVFDMWDSV